VNKLWNKNFIRVVAGMTISAAGGIGLNIALSVVVFEQTHSTMLSSVFAALSMVPNFFLPMIIGPWLDRRNPLKVLLKNESILAAFFLLSAICLHFMGFNYFFMMGFSIIVSCFGVVSQLASASIVPQVMQRNDYMRGNAVINVIYPLCSVIMTPVMMWLFKKYGVALSVGICAITGILDVIIESGIRAEFEFIEKKAEGLKDYFRDAAQGMRYLKHDIGVRSVFTFVMLMEFVWTASLLWYPFFSKTPGLGSGDYALMQSISSMGYLLGGLFHYIVKILDKRRFQVAVCVYIVFATLDGIFLLMPFVIMCVIRFVLGVLGMNSANIRESSVQARVPNTMRAKLNAFKTILISALIMLGQMTVGALGEVFPYWSIQLGMSGIYLLGVFFIVLPKKHKVRELYNYDADCQTVDISV